MILDAKCAICGSTSCKEFPSQIFSRFKERSEYHQSRIEFFLDEWFEGADEAEIFWYMCRQCGFIYYTPRPEETDLAHKYSVLSTGKLAGGEPQPAERYDETKWRRADPKNIHANRATDLYRTLAPFCNKELHILDYGGGAGALLEPFLLNGHRCDVCDYSVRKPLPGIAYAGPTEESIPADQKYDMIICSHVFEHLADPTMQARRLLNRLKPDGILYIEVPCEIFRQRPRPNEPVTHQNYFSVYPVRTMLELAGGDVLGCHYAPFRTYADNFGLAVKSVTMKGGSGKATSFSIALEFTSMMIEGRVQPLLKEWLPGAFHMH